MTVATTTHINFCGDARAALEFYQSVFGGQLVLVTYEDLGAVQDPAEAQHIMWGQVAADSGFRVMAFDVPGSRTFDRGDDSFFISLRGTSDDEISAWWEKLADGALIRTPLAPAQWSALYGMLTDRFGITWVIDVDAEYAAS